MSKRCKNCRWAWWLNGDPVETDMPTLDNGGLGECRRSHPANGEYGLRDFPIVRSEDWCGEWDTPDETPCRGIGEALERK